jgi:hypothetical protein
VIVSLARLLNSETPNTVMFAMFAMLLGNGIRCPATRHEGAWGERRYSSYSFSTSALDGVSGQRHAPAALYLRGKDPWIGGWEGPRNGLDAEAR